MGCLDEERLSDLLGGALSAEARLAAEAHLDACEACRALVADLLAARSSAVHAEGSGPDELHALNPGGATLRPGAEVLGRYLILRRLGMGSMGVVFAAYDQTLDRKVALKLLRRGRWTAPGRSDGEVRLLREAQTLARLSHPNLVVVHDVGAVDEPARGQPSQLFMAMEFVDGQDLRSWLAGDPRPTSRRILAAFIDAGRGLAAAHAAGVVHRDFKPDNVLVGADGRVRVTDFGLARRQLAPNDIGADDASASASASLASATRTGALIGTPLYMSPEQFTGARADARSDQFSFCVALFLALYGQHPFAGDTVDALATAVAAGRRRALAPGVRAQAPRRVHRALTRGLSIDPEARFPTMEALCDALAGRPGRALILGLLIALVVVAAGVLVAVLTDRRLGPAAAGGVLCEGAERRLAGVWDETRKATLRARFATDAADAAAFTAFERDLDAYLGRWLAVHTDTCEATFAAGTQSQEIFRTQFRCLHRQLAELDAALAAATQTASGGVGALSWTLSTQVRPEACIDVHQLSATWDRDGRVDLLGRAVRAQLARAQALAGAGDTAAALALARELSAAADVLGDRSLLVEVLLRLGAMETRAGEPAAAEQTLRRALGVAEASAIDAHLAEIWFELASAVSALGRYREALEDLDRAFTWTARTAPPELLRATLLHHRGVILDAMGRFEEAESAHRLALSIRRTKLGGPPLAVAASLNLIGAALTGRGRPEEALAPLREALTLREAALGPAHSRVAGTLNNLGEALTALGRPDEATEVLSRALAIRRARGVDDAGVAMVLDNLGRLALAAGDPAGALEHHERSCALHEAALGPTHPRVGVSHHLRAAALAALDRHDEALAGHRRAVDLLERAAGPEGPALIGPLLGEGLALLALGAPAEALPRLERALALAERFSAAPWIRARLRLALARALAGDGPPTGRSRALSDEALLLLGEAGVRFADEAAAAAATLDDRPPQARKEPRDNPGGRSSPP